MIIEILFTLFLWFLGWLMLRSEIRSRAVKPKRSGAASSVLFIAGLIPLSDMLSRATHSYTMIEWFIAILSGLSVLFAAGLGAVLIYLSLHPQQK